MHPSAALATAQICIGFLPGLPVALQDPLHSPGIFWKEIVRVGNTQKIITTTGQNTFDEVVSVRKCSQPNERLRQLLDILKAKHKPFKKIKSVVHKPPS